MFKDRKVAQTASELLRECVGISSTTPYHKSLRAAISLAIKLVKDENPGYQAKANLDLNGKTLKCFLRPDSNPPGSWAPCGSNIPLPAEALDPTCKNFDNMRLQPPMRTSLGTPGRKPEPLTQGPPGRVRKVWTSTQLRKRQVTTLPRPQNLRKTAARYSRRRI